MSTRNSLLIPVFKVVLFLFVFTSCGSGGGGGGENSKEKIRFINADPKSSKLIFEVLSVPETTKDNIKADSSSIGLLEAEVSYLNSTDFLESPEGKLKITVRTDDSILPAAQSEIQIDSNQIYTITATRVSDALTLASNLEKFSLKAPESGNTNLRFINLSETNPSVDVYLIDTSFSNSISQALKDTTPGVTALSFKTFGSYLAFKPTKLILVVTLSGSKTNILYKKELDFSTPGRFSNVFFSQPDKSTSLNPLISRTYIDFE